MVNVGKVLIALAQAAATMSATPSPDERVLVAAVRGVASQLLTEEARQDGAVACILLNHDGAPEPPHQGFLREFAKQPFVLSGAACESGPEGVVESGSGAPAFLITVGPVEWVASDERHVHVVFRRRGSHTHRRLYRVVREPSGWVSLGQIIEMSPA
jgi:hypothetical protein